MLGKISQQPHAYTPAVSLNHVSPAHQQPLKNAVTGLIIHVEQTHTDFRVLAKERALFNEVKRNPCLATVADAGAHTRQSTRLYNLGMAVTVVSNLGENGKAKEKADEICDNNPREKSDDITVDGAINKRGLHLMHDFVNAETPLDATIYATGLRVGLDVRRLDPFMVKQLNSTWGIRLNQITPLTEQRAEK